MESVTISVGRTGFEPATPWSQTTYSTGLNYLPKIFILSDLLPYLKTHCSLKSSKIWTQWGTKNHYEHNVVRFVILRVLRGLFSFHRAHDFSERLQIRAAKVRV